MNKPMAAIDCFIDGCDWWVDEPPEVRSGPDRDEIALGHLVIAHTVEEVLQEVHRRTIELGPYPHVGFTIEQIEDRNSIIYIMRNAIHG